MIRSVCVFSSSSDAVAADYKIAAAELGAAIARRQWVLVYGGCRVGLMGAVARSAHAHGGRVVGVIPECFNRHELPYEQADELIVTRDLRERKAIMETRADAFVALPGGFGTLEEILEILTLKQLASHNKPIVFLNTAGFFDPLLTLFERIFVLHFAKEEGRVNYHVAASAEEVVSYLDNYQPPTQVEKWFPTRPGGKASAET